MHAVNKTFLCGGGHFGDCRDSAPRPNAFNATLFKGYWYLVSNGYTGTLHNFHEGEKDIRRMKKM
jgi:hypothetical protein